MAVCAHPGHGSEYIEEVQSSSTPSTSEAHVSSSESASSGSSVSSSSSSSSSSYSSSSSSSSGHFSSGSSGGSSYNSASSSGGSDQSGSSDSSSGISEVKDNSTVEEVNKTNNNTHASDKGVNENNGLFSVNNIILLVITLFCGFFISVIMSKIIFKK